MRASIAFLLCLLPCVASQAQFQKWMDETLAHIELRMAGSPMEALAGHRKVLAEMEAAGFVTNNALTPRVLNEIASIQQDFGEILEAEQHYLRAIHWFESHNSLTEPSAVSVVSNLGTLYFETRQLARLRDLCSKASDVLEELPDGAEAASLKLMIGLSDHLNGDLDRAQKLLHSALETLRNLPGDHTSAIGDALNALAAIKYEQHDDQESLFYVNQALAAYQAAGLGTKPAALSTLTNKACIYVRLSRFADADVLFARVLERLRETVGPNHQMVGRVMYAYSCALDEMGKSRRAKAHRKRAENILAEYEEAAPGRHVVDVVDLLREGGTVE